MQIFAWVIGIISIIFPFVFLIVVYRQQKEIERDLEEMFELRERMSTSRFHGSVAKSLFTMRRVKNEDEIRTCTRAFH